MFDERDTDGPAWAWLRGFAWFLLMWPLLSLMARDKFDAKDWEAIAIAILGPAAIGLILLAVERALTLLFGRSRKAAPRPVPNILRDVSNLGIAMAILLIVDVALVTVFDDDPLIKGGDPRAATLAWQMLGVCCAAAIAFRGLARLIYGRSRIVDMGEGWDRAPNVMRLLGYLTLIPMLLVCTVMIDYTLHQRPDFGLVAWIVLPALLWLGLRSAMARAPRWWARNPWEAWLRSASLGLPWWIIGVAFALGFVALCLLIPVGLVDDTMTTRGRIIGGIIMVPLGLLVLVMVGMTVVRGLPSLIRNWLAARRLAYHKDDIVAFGATSTPGQVRVQVHTGKAAVFELGEQAPATLEWLQSR